MAMTAIMGIMAVASAATSVVGGVIAAQGAKAQAQAEKQAADFQAAQMEIKAKEERAAAFHEKEEERKKTARATERHRLLAAAGGFDPMSADIQTTGTKLEEYGKLKQMMALYGGASRARGLKDQAGATRKTGRDAIIRGNYAAAGHMVAGIGGAFNSLASGFGGSASKGSTTTNYTFGAGAVYNA